VKKGLYENMKKLLVIILAAALFCGCTNARPEPDPPGTDENITIGGKEYSIDLTSLSIEWLKLTAEDMEQLALMTNLTRLEVKMCEITDISPLAELTKLERLDLRFNEISDLSPLAELVNLTHLNLSHNEIRDVSALVKLANLRELELGANYISDLSPLYGKLTKLVNLYIYDNNPDTIDDYLFGSSIRAGFPEGCTIHF
jgi:Leucine-rich repeat (LRR) protein